MAMFVCLFVLLLLLFFLLALSLLKQNSLTIHLIQQANLRIKIDFD